MSKRIGIIGCGTIGRELAFAIDNSFVGEAAIVFLFDTVITAASDLRGRLVNNSPTIFSTFSHLTSSESFKQADIVVEAASQEAVRAYANKIVLSDKSLMIMSAGALSDSCLLHALYNTVANHDSHIYVPTGAIAGIDAIFSVKHLIDFVMLTTTKNPKALTGAPYFKLRNIKPESIKKKTLLYDGNATDAAKLFPSNVNVAVILGLAGRGTSNTRVRIVADPRKTQNEHQIIVRGIFGEISIMVRNVPSPSNPKTSFLASLSAIECLRRICNNKIRIGT
jgi:aspartate dehydrogenase